MNVIDMAPVHELMQYYHLDFTIYYISLIVCVLFTARAILHRKEQKRFFSVDLVISVLMVFGACSGLIFQGALLDVSNGAYNGWLYKLAVIAGMNLVLTIVQAAVFLKRSARN